jgi:hypothetical protein
MSAKVFKLSVDVWFTDEGFFSAKLTSHDFVWNAEIVRFYLENILNTFQINKSETR